MPLGPAKALRITKQKIRASRLWPFIRHIARLKSQLFPPASNAFHIKYASIVAGGEIQVRPRNIPGSFWMPACSDLARRIVLEGAYEPEITNQLKDHRNLTGCIVNVGANIGLIAHFLAASCPKAESIIAVEPNPEAYKFLERNVRENGMVGRIELANSCIGDAEKEVEFACIPGKPEYSSIGSIVHDAVAGLSVRKVPVSQRRLSSIVGTRRVSMIFADVEGAEHLVLQGALDILVRDRPIIIFECSDRLLAKFGSGSVQVEKFLVSCGYVVRDVLIPGVAIRHPMEGEAIATWKG